MFPCNPYNNFKEAIAVSILLTIDMRLGETEELYPVMQQVSGKVGI